MLKDSQFAKDAQVAEKLIKDGEKILKNILFLINSERKEEAIREAMKYELISEKIVNNARLMPIDTGTPGIQEEITQNILQENQIKIEYLNNNSWFHVKIPSLLPKKEKGNPSFIRATLQIALKKYFNENPKIKIKEPSTIIFKHNYSIERPEREYRDHDNIELNAVVDMITLFVLIDDSPLKLRHYYYSCIEETDSTDIYIIPNSDFIDFCQKNNY